MDDRPTSLQKMQTSAQVDAEAIAALKDELPRPVLTDEQRAQLTAIFERRIAIYRLKEGEERRWSNDYDYGEVVAHTVDAIEWLAAECGLLMKEKG